MKVIIVRDRISAGGGIHSYYEAIRNHFTVKYEFVGVGRSHEYFTSGKLFLNYIPTPLRLLFDWAVFLLKLLQFPDLVHLNPGLDIKTYKSIRREAVNICLAKIFRRPVIVFWRGWDNDACGTSEFPSGYLGWMYRIYRRADVHIVLANQFRDDLIRWGFKQPIYVETTVVPDSLLDHIESKPKQVNNSFRILFLSRVEVAKGVLELLDAFALLSIRRPGYYHLTIAGDGPDLQMLKKKTKQYKLSNINFVGYVEGREKRQCYADANAFCLLSYSEGMPNSALEAMVMKLPLISSAAGGLKDILHDGLTGCIVNRTGSHEYGKMFSPEDVADCFERLAMSEEMLRKIGEYNQEYAVRRFSSMVVANRLEEIYHKTILTSRFKLKL